MNYFLILDSLVLIIFVVCLLGGLCRGFKKNLRKLISLIIPTILFFIFLNPISNKIMNIEIDLNKVNEIVDVIPEEYTEQTYSIDKALSLVISDMVYPNSTELQKDSQMKELIESLAVMIIKITIYFSGLTCIWFTSLILRLILRIFFGKEKRNNKALGMLVGAGHFALASFLFLLPLFGTLSLVASVVNDINEYVEVEDGSLDDVLIYTNMYEESIVKSQIIDRMSVIFYKDDSLSFDARYVLGAFTFEYNETKVNLKDEYLEIKEALPSITKVINLVNELENTNKKEIDLSVLTDEDIENISSVFRNSHLIRAIIPAALEYAVYSLEQEESDYTETFNKLKTFDWNKEFILLANLINVLKEHNDFTINIENTDALIKSEGVIDLVEDLATGATQIELINQILIPYAIISLESEFTSGEYEKYQIDFTKINSINWKMDGPSFITTGLNIYREYLKVNIDFSDIKVALNDTALPGFVTYVFKQLDDSNIITDTLIPTLMQVLIANLETNEELSNLDIDFEALKNVNWKDNLDSIEKLLHDVIQSYQTLNVDPDNFKDVLTNNELQTELNKVINSALECEVFAEYILPIVMNVLIDNLEKNESLTSFGFDFTSIKNTNWKTELLSIKDVVCEFLNAYQDLEFDKDNWMNIFDNANLANHIENIYTKAKNSSLVSEHILPKLPNKVHELLDNTNTSLDVSFLKELITEESIDTLFTNDVDKFIVIFKDIKELGLFDNKELDISNPLTQDTLIKIIKEIFNLELINGKESIVFESIINMIDLTSLLDEYNITLDYDNVTNWNKEVDYICKIFKNILSFSDNLDEFDFSTLLTNNQTEEQKTAIVSIICSIANSELFGDSIYEILSLAASSYDETVSIELSNEEKNIIENVNGWEYEITLLLDVIEEVKSFDFEVTYESLDASELKGIMITSSEGIITTKLLGTILNNVFDGIVECDFTNQETLKSSADVVYNAIKVASLIQNPTLDLNDLTVTDELISSMEEIALKEENIDLTNQFLNEIIGNDTPVDYSKEEITEAADVVETIISTYQNTLNQDEFSLENLSDSDKELVENSDIAKAILDLLFNKLNKKQEYKKHLFF